MAEPIRAQTQEDEERRRDLDRAPVYDEGARRQQSDLYEQIAARGPFQYDADRDPIYRVTRDRYVQDGRMAMKDSMGQAAALTGGYGSSYGQAVGQQQYDASLRGLSAVIPELYEQAYRMYRDQGDALQQQYELLGRQADRDYDRYRDQLGDWRSERDWQQEREDQAYDRAADAYARLYALISATGYSPTEEELLAAGMSREAAEALIREYLRQTGQGNPGGGSGNTGGWSGHSGGSGGRTEEKLSLEAVAQQARAARHSNQHRELYEASLQAISEGRASFTRRELDALWNRNNWFN
ncbi:MAG: hypothetical protein IKH34_04090 [Oscillospiraceae bacterium]|nr:hypothetical protein [Oscillospiraceae bacterium]